MAVVPPANVPQVCELSVCELTGNAESIRTEVQDVTTVALHRRQQGTFIMAVLKNMTT